MPHSYEDNNKAKNIFVSIWNLRIPKIYLARKPTFENWFIWVRHQAKGSTHLNKRIYNFQNNDNSLITNTHTYFSMDVPTPNMLISSSSTLWINPSCPLLETISIVQTIRFIWSKIVLKREMTSFTSSSTMKQIAFPQPKENFTTYNDLKWGFNINANILWTWQESKAFKNSKKSLITSQPLATFSTKEMEFHIK